MLYLQTEQSPEKTDSLSGREPTAVPDSIIKTDTANTATPRQPLNRRSILPIHQATFAKGATI